MYDPLTVALEIRYPWWRTRRWGKNNEFVTRDRSPFITVWHRDP